MAATLAARGVEGPPTLPGAARSWIMLSMRSRLLVPLLLALALLALPAIAAAGPKPIKKPDAPARTATPPAKAPTAPTVPTHTASTNTNTTTNTTPTTNTSSTKIDKPSSTGSSTGSTSGAKTQLNGTGAVTPKVVFVNVIGRDQSTAEITMPPADVIPKVAAPDPTPLAIVSVGDRIRSHSTSTPVWMLGLLGVLAAAEAFLVVRLVRNRPRGLQTVT